MSWIDLDFGKAHCPALPADYVEWSVSRETKQQIVSDFRHEIRVEWIGMEFGLVA